MTFQLKNVLTNKYPHFDTVWPPLWKILATSKEHPSTDISNTILDIPQRSILRRRWLHPKRKIDLSVVGVTVFALGRCLSMSLNKPAAYIKKRSGPRELPCGTPDPRLNASDMQFFIRILCFLKISRRPAISVYLVWHQNPSLCSPRGFHVQWRHWGRSRQVAQPPVDPY